MSYPEPKPTSMLLFFAPGAPREAYFESLAEWAVTGQRPMTRSEQISCSNTTPTGSTAKAR
jgi:hypothetical protein